MSVLAHIIDDLLAWQILATVIVLAATAALVLSTLSRRRLRRSLETNLRDQARLRTVLTQTPAILWTTDRDLRITSSEGAGLAALDLRPGQLVGATLQEYFQTDDPAYVPLAIHYDALAGRSGNYQVDYGDRTYEVHCEPLRDAHQQIAGVVVAALDVTDAKTVQRNLARSEAKYRALLQAIPDVMFSMTRTGRIVEFIDKLTAPADYFGKSVLDVFPPVVAQQFLNTAAAVLDTGRAQALEYQTGDGGDARRHFEARMVNCCDGEVLVILRNITDRRRAEDELRRREVQLRSLVRAIPDTIFQLTPDGRIAGCVAPNPDELLMSPDQFLGRPLHDVLPPHVAALVGTHLRAAVETGRPQVVQYSLDMPGGTRWYEARLVAAGDLVTAVVRNITDVRTRSYVPVVARTA